MTTTAPVHISVCVCTYKRQELLERLLIGLCAQQTSNQFTYSIVVADNDHLESAKALISHFAATSAIPIKYCVEPRQNIALARNMAVMNASGDFVAFIDDDEIPVERWLYSLLKACISYGVDGVLGPVKPQFDKMPPKWVIKGKFYDRATYPTGFVIDWRKGRTGNVLLKRALFEEESPPFRPEFLSGEDQDFFRRMIDRGHVFIWCNEAVAYEVVPPLRWKRTFMLKRALLRGAISRIDPTLTSVDIAKSIIAVPAYAAFLPVALVLGQHRFMSCMVKLCDHLGRLLALIGVKPIKESYVTE